MSERRGEKIGWTGGWIGGFIWLLVLSIVWMYQGDRTNGSLGIALFIVAIAAIIIFAPWRHPETPYWRLMLPVYACLFLSIALALAHYRPFMDQMRENIFTWWWIFLFVVPLFSMGKRTWKM